jgi:hypothetical protein
MHNALVAGQGIMGGAKLPIIKDAFSNALSKPDQLILGFQRKVIRWLHASVPADTPDVAMLIRNGLENGFKAAGVLASPNVTMVYLNANGTLFDVQTAAACEQSPTICEAIQFEFELVVDMGHHHQLPLILAYHQSHYDCKRMVQSRLRWRGSCTWLLDTMCAMVST